MLLQRPPPLMMKRMTKMMKMSKTAPLFSMTQRAAVVMYCIAVDAIRSSVG
jgi:hypothetical protein